MNTKSAIIFEDKTEDQEVPKSTTNGKVLTLSRDDYRETIKAAYQEGLKDAQEKKDKQETQQDQQGLDKDAKDKGREEAIKMNAKEREENRQRLKIIADRQDIEMLNAQSVFPFTLFTDTIIIDTTKINIAKKQLFATEFVTTIPLKDLSDITVQTVLFLGSITIKYMPQSSSPGMNEPVEIRIPNLTRSNAIKAKNILKGVLVAKAEEIDIAKLSPEEIQEVLEKFGESSGVI